MSIKSALHLEIDIEDMDYRFTLKNELKEVIGLIPEDKGMNTVRTFLENLRIRL